MPSTRSLITRLRNDFPDITFARGDNFRWSPHDRTIFYANSSDAASLVHELSHALLGHDDYRRDIELIKMERDAWQYASEYLADTYEIPLDTDFIEDALDTYRNWLHSRSICPSCQATGIQTAPRLYECLACTTRWKVNDARSCALRRYSLPRH